ncbi:MAG: lysostaphin resistance A-like protein [Sphingomonas sp.]
MTEAGDTGKRGLRWVFWGSEGLRAGWSLLLFVIVAVLLVAGLNFILPPHPPGPGQATAIHIIRQDGLQFLVMALAALLVSLVERRSFGRYGLRGDRVVGDVAQGLAWGLVMLSALIGAMAALGGLRFNGVALHGGDIVSYGAQWAAAFALVGLFEEFFTRGFLQYTTARGVAGIVRAIAPGSRYARTIGFWVGAAIFSVGIFAAGHLANPGETTTGLIAVMLAGVTFAYAVYRTGSLWWAIGFHTSWDWAQSYLYGVNDSGLAVVGHLLDTTPTGAALVSGGTTGPEGSILVIPTLLATIAIIHWTLPKRATAFDG